MATIFVNVPLYHRLSDKEVVRLKRKLNLKGWKTGLKGFHPMFDISINNLVASGHRVRFCNIRGDGNLPRVRAMGLGVWKAEWDKGARSDYFMNIDDDISFTPEGVNILIEDDKPIVGGIYTYKSSDEYFRGRPCSVVWPNNMGNLSGPFQIRWLNGGFTMIKAETLLTMIEKYADLGFDIDEDSPIGVKESWALWCPKVYKENGQRAFLSEDYAFCQRAREAGFDIWADWRVKLFHWNGENGYSLTIKE